MKSLEDLTDLQKEILKSLKPGRSRSKSLKDIREFLQEEHYPTEFKDIRDGLGKLIEYGAVRGMVEKTGRKYFLSRVIGSGYRNQAMLLGKPNPFRDTYKLIQRIVGGIFLLLGFIFLYQNLTISGAVVSEVIKNKSTPLIFSLVSIFIGAFLLFLSAKKKNS
jgi:hypothetical protein